MEPERWRKINDLFQRATGLDESVRLSFLKEECAGDEQLFEEVSRIVSAHGSAGDFIEQPAFSEALSIVAEEKDSESFIDRQFGGYKLKKLIGRGGMGSVYLAERADEQFEKQVAVKIIKRGMDTESVIKRFRYERQILASLEHPNIGRLLDGGTTESGLPYFVMEYIEGQPITKYVREKGLSIRERLELFRQVCSAVAYAHQRLVIHRDLKSSNILVTDAGVPKLLDFGIAKLMTGRPFSDEHPVTETGLQMMTPEYASPEQVKGENVTTATDIYSLGVVLYELLTGERPFDRHFRKSGKIFQAVMDTEPPRPSDIVSDRQTLPSPLRNEVLTYENDGLLPTEKIGDKETDEPVGEPDRKSTSVNSRYLRGDIDNIILKALRKEPENRYLTVDQFSEDIRRHLVGLPVIARPLSYRYRLTKFIGRNKVAAGLGAIIFLVLIGGIITTTLQSIRAEREKELAEKRFRDVRKLVNTVLFDYHDAIKDLPGSTPVRAKLVRDALQYLDVLAAEAGDDLSLQRELAAAYERVGDVQGGTAVANLGDTNGAIESYKKSLTVREKILGIEPNGYASRRDVAFSRIKLGNLLWETGDMKSALDYNQSALEIFLKLHRERPDDAEVKYNLGLAYNSVGVIIHDRGDFNDALEHFLKSQVIFRSLPENLRQTEKVRRANSLVFEQIGIAYLSMGDYEKALENNGRALEMRIQLSADFPNNADYLRTVSVSYYNHGEILDKLSRYREARENYRRDVEIVESLARQDPQNEQYRGDVAYGLVRLGDMDVKLGSPQTALRHYQKSQSIRAVDVKNDPSNLWKKSSLIDANAKICKTLSMTGLIEETEKKCTETLAMMRETKVEPDNILIRNFFAETYDHLGSAYLAMAKSRKEYSKQSCDLYKDSFAIYSDLKSRGVFGEAEFEKLAGVRRQIETCDPEFKA
jgi:eukaryotic-like serine/threonine-protein kinase